MPDLAYGEVYAMNPVQARKRLHQTYRKTNSIRKTATLWHTSRHVVRKWVRREAQGGHEALQDRSRRHLTIPPARPPQRSKTKWCRPAARLATAASAWPGT